MRAAALRAAIEGELRENLLPFWRQRSEDHERGGFIAEMANDGTVRADALRGLILNSRLLWTFSALYRQLAEPRDLELARRAYATLESTFRDREHGGYVWRVDPAGRPLERAKKIYGQAFCIYALSEYHLATGEDGALEAVRALYKLVERHAHDARDGGYIEARAADWSVTADLRLSDVDMDAAKSMNTHLHLLEAYTNLYRAWPDAGVDARLRELIDVFGRHILDLGGGPGHGHLRHFFDEEWRVLSDTCTYGHDIEASWLLCEAAEVLDDERLAASVREWAMEMALTVLEQAVDDDGGLAYEGRNGTVLDPRRDWWCQAEAVVGFWHAFQLTGDRAQADAAHRVWSFIQRRVVDRSGGDWFSRVGADGNVDQDELKVSEWKGPYHNVRMCLEMMRRIAADGA
jgi:mannobiose 2-epimerase